MKRWWPLLSVAFFLLLPLFVAGGWLYANDRWAPVFDMALTEMRVRDVGTVHTPLVGLPGRLGRMSNGSHPGPLSFYLLAPVHRLLGGSYWALRISTIALDALAIVSALMIGRRRAGVPGLVATGLLLGALELGFGLLVLTEPWNPHLPILWFATFLLATWSVACGDVKLLPIVAASGSFCAQTHIPYVAICGGIGALLLVHFAASWIQTARAGRPQREYARACATAVGVAGVLWMPPLIEELSQQHGNLSLLVEFFRDPLLASVGFQSAWDLVLGRLDGWHLLVRSFAEPSLLTDLLDSRQPSPERGLTFLVLWMAATVVAWRLRNPSLLALHGVVASAIVVALVAISRIVGAPWNYLLFSVWLTCALMLGAIGATLGLAAQMWMPERLRLRGGRIAQALGIVAVASYGICLAMRVDKAGSSTPNPCAQLAAVVPSVVTAIERRVGAATGKDGLYLVTWSDGLYGGGQGIGLVNELERHGLHVGVPHQYSKFMRQHRVLYPWNATARIHLATLGWIHDAGKEPGAIRIGYSDPRSTQAREEFLQIRADMASAMREVGRGDAISLLDRDLAAAVAVKEIHPLVRSAISRMADLGGPLAVFVRPATRP